MDSPSRWGPVVSMGQHVLELVHTAALGAEDIDVKGSTPAHSTARHSCTRTHSCTPPGIRTAPGQRPPPPYTHKHTHGTHEAAWHQHCTDMREHKLSRA